MITLLAATLAFQELNTLTPREIRQGWKLLFDGKTTTGWHNFKQKTISDGWQVKDGVLMCADPHKAGDIVTDDKYDWFELKIDWNVSKMGNSGVMFHCADDGDTMWMSGPEIQIMDKAVDPNGQLAGFLYEIYKSPIDSTNPPGEWNTFDILISPKRCATYVNGKMYYEYVLNSPDFWDRVKKSKFGSMPNFSKLTKGTIGLQGDHGVVSFRNIKIRQIKA